MAGTDLSYMIDSADIDRYLDAGSKKIIKYSELDQFRTIEELLPNDKDYKIILIEQNPNSGHWTCILRYGKTCEFFDSYGLRFDEELNFISKVKNRLLGQDVKLLSLLLNDAKARGWNVIWNKTKLQQLKNGVNTCGRWCLLRITMLTQFYFELEEFIAFIEKNFKGGSVSKDKMICNWIK